jgi:hypothetical protein
MPEASNGQGKGSWLRPVDPKKFAEGYLRAFGICFNRGCESRYTCYRWLTTRSFTSTERIPLSAYVPELGRCEYYSRCETKTEFNEMEQSNE